ncbi:hypothetical protein RND71_037430 [Anisodus tanguticus]|uniref:Uncharacterized protein n=1 Tax=Anisodus tanguticus TaxID=243964 RepID=A0AAE1UYV6_9SOLA|nr:hypothetical protein RND71_037430 [Anisodus tanguticus]
MSPKGPPLLYQLFNPTNCHSLQYYLTVNFLEFNPFSLVTFTFCSTKSSKTGL